MVCMPNMVCHLHMHNLCGSLLHMRHFLYILGKQIRCTSLIFMIRLPFFIYSTDNSWNLVHSRLNYNCTIAERFWRTIVAVGCIVTAVLVTYSRVYLLYHSNTQVFFGALIGLALGTAWFIIVHMILTPFFPIVVSWLILLYILRLNGIIIAIKSFNYIISFFFRRISEYLLLRDTTLIPNVLWFEYTSIRTEARARARKLSAIGRSH